VIVGTVREIKTEEYRVGLTPEGVRELVRLGHTVLVEAGAGAGSGYSDDAYGQAGAEITSADGVWAGAQLVVKVKEPQVQEFTALRRDQTLFTYLHLAAAPDVTAALLKAGTTSLAYETVQLPDGTLPLLVPMSQIAGRMAPQVAARWLQKPGPGRGKLLSGLPGSPAARVVILGSGTVALNACDIALGMGARVTLLGRDLAALRRVADLWPHRVVTLPLNRGNIELSLTGADVLISGILVRGGPAAPRLITRADLRLMGPGAVAVDVSIDQGGVLETSRPTTHTDPVYVEEDVVHYCVANMPGAVSYTSTNALTAATLPYVTRLAELGADKAVAADPALARGLMTRNGELVNKSVAQGMRGT
jgi:alanine dehydrogenase